MCVCVCAPGVSLEAGLTDTGNQGIIKVKNSIPLDFREGMRAVSWS